MRIYYTQLISVETFDKILGYNVLFNLLDSHVYII